MKACILSTILLLFSLLDYAQIPNNIPMDGLIAFWPLDGNVNDASGNGNSSTPFGVSYGLDRFGLPSKCCVFNGSGFITAEGVVNLPLGASSRTMSFWMKSQSSLPPLNRDIFGWGDYSTSKRFAFATYDGSNYFVGQWDDIFGSQFIHDGNWHHIVVTYNGSTVLMYVDSQLNAVAQKNLNTQNATCVFGRSCPLTHPNPTYFEGMLDEVAIWNRALSIQEIQSLYFGCDVYASISFESSPTVCSGQPVVMIAPTGNNFMYQWYYSGNPIAGANSISYTAFLAGVYAVEVSNGFCSETEQTTIEVNALPLVNIEANGSLTICSGQSTVLSATATDASNYLWNLNGTAIAGANASSFTAFLGGTYSLTAINENGCSSTSNDLIMTVTPPPMPMIFPSVNYVSTGTTASFSVSGADGSTAYQWQTNPCEAGWMNLPNNSSYSGVTESTMTVSNIALSNHLQPFTVTAQIGNCVGTSPEAYISVLDTCINNEIVYDTVYTIVTDTLLINVTIVGVGEPNVQNLIRIYPNPTSDHITIDYGNIDLMSGYSLSIFNSMGQIVHTSNINNQSEYIDVNAWGSAGVYQVVINDPQGNTVSTKQIVLQ
jgi:hypothetical protein